MTKLANLFLVAAPRSGSTQLSRWLETHPDISMSVVKEPNHYAAHEFAEDYVRRSHLNDVDPAMVEPTGSRRYQFAVFREKDDYERLFAPLTARWRLDASTSYLSCPEAPARIAADAPDARIILLTRDPIERAISHFRLAHRTGRETRPLGQVLEAETSGQTSLPERILVRPSRQTEGCARFREAFDAAAILHIRFEDFTADPLGTLAEIARFLEVPDKFDTSIAARNESRSPRWSRLNQFIQSCGLKTHLRRHLPPALKAGLKRLWFTETRLPVSAEDRAALQRAVERA